MDTGLVSNTGGIKVKKESTVNENPLFQAVSINNGPASNIVNLNLKLNTNFQTSANNDDTPKRKRGRPRKYPKPPGENNSSPPKPIPKPPPRLNIDKAETLFPKLPNALPHDNKMKTFGPTPLNTTILCIPLVIGKDSGSCLFNPFINALPINFQTVPRPITRNRCIKPKETTCKKNDPVESTAPPKVILVSQLLPSAGDLSGTNENANDNIPIDNLVSPTTTDVATSSDKSDSFHSAVTVSKPIDSLENFNQNEESIPIEDKSISIKKECTVREFDSPGCTALDPVVTETKSTECKLVMENRNALPIENINSKSVEFKIETIESLFPKLSQNFINDELESKFASNQTKSVVPLPEVDESEAGNDPRCLLPINDKGSLNILNKNKGIYMKNYLRNKILLRKKRLNIFINKSHTRKNLKHKPRCLIKKSNLSQVVQNL